MHQCTVCGSLKVENKDLQLCATHNKERLKAAREQDNPKPVKIYTLKQTPIKQLSSKTSKRKAAMVATQKKMREKGIRWCETCGCTDSPLSHSHTLPEGEFPELASEQDNMVYECYGHSASCHYIWENGSIEQKLELRTFKARIMYILNTRPGYLERFILNHSKGRDYESIRCMVLKKASVGS